MTETPPIDHETTEPQEPAASRDEPGAGDRPAAGGDAAATAPDAQPPRTFAGAVYVDRDE